MDANCRPRVACASINELSVLSWASRRDGHNAKPIVFPVWRRRGGSFQQEENPLLYTAGQRDFGSDVRYTDPRRNS